MSEADGVWSKDIEEAFEEALAIYPPCGRRKIILSDEGKMFGRNELIARYIKMRTGKQRSRKQVSSHIQVLARKKQRDLTVKLRENCDEVTQMAVLDNLTSMSSAQIVSATMTSRKASKDEKDNGGYEGEYNNEQERDHPHGWENGERNHYYEGAKPHAAGGNGYDLNHLASMADQQLAGDTGYGYDRLRAKMVDFSAYLEYRLDNTDSYYKHLFCNLNNPHAFTDPAMEYVDIRQIYDKFPGLKERYTQGPQNAFFLVKFWADISYEQASQSFYGISSKFVSDETMNMKLSTKVCSFGKQVVEKIQTEYSTPENGKFSYNFSRSPMCEYMISFVEKLKALENKEMMNSVLENFSVLQLVTNDDTNEILLCIAYVFEVSGSEHGTQNHVYKLVE